MARLDLPSDTPSKALPGSGYLLLGWGTPCSASTLRYKQEDQKFIVILGYF